MKVPKPYICNTGDPPNPSMDLFFMQVIRGKGLHRHPSTEVQGKRHTTDGWTYLLVSENKVVASVIEWRSEFNRCHWHYAVY